LSSVIRRQFTAENNTISIQKFIPFHDRILCRCFLYLLLPLLPTCPTYQLAAAFSSHRIPRTHHGQPFPTPLPPTAVYRLLRPFAHLKHKTTNPQIFRSKQAGYSSSIYQASTAFFVELYDLLTTQLKFTPYPITRPPPAYLLHDPTGTKQSIPPSTAFVSDEPCGLPHESSPTIKPLDRSTKAPAIFVNLKPINHVPPHGIFFEAEQEASWDNSLLPLSPQLPPLDEPPGPHIIGRTCCTYHFRPRPAIASTSSKPHSLVFPTHPKPSFPNLL